MGGKHRVLMLTSGRDWGGGQTQVWLLIRGLRERGFEPILADEPSGRLAARVEALGVRVIPISIRGDADIPAVLRLQRILREEEINIIHSHTANAHAVASWATIKMKTRPVHVVSRRVTFPPGKNFFSRMKYARGVDVFIAISNAVKKVLLEHSIPEERIRIVPSGIDLSRYQGPFAAESVRRQLSLSGNEIVVGTIGTLCANKAQDDFLKAASWIARELPQARFVVVGEGEKRRFLEKLAERLGLSEKVIFTGFVEDVTGIMSILDCFVISSLMEGLCTSIMAAQAIGVPVVATETGGIPELIDNGLDGMLVPAKAPDRIAEAVLHSISNTDYRTRCVTKAREKAKKYDYSLMVERTLGVYDEMLMKKEIGPARH